MKIDDIIKEVNHSKSARNKFFKMLESGRISLHIVKQLLSSDIRGLVPDALAKNGSKKWISLLISAYNKEKIGDLCDRYLHAIGKIGGREAETFLYNLATSSEDIHFKVIAVYCISKSGNNKLIAKLKKELTQKNEKYLLFILENPDDIRVIATHIK